MEHQAPDDGTDLLDLTRALNAALSGDGTRLESGDCLGNYILDHCLGEGGMGTVWLADQVEPVRRQVAIKLTRKRRMSRHELDLFMLERQALARMNHPAVGQIFEAGTLDDGAPFFIMEYVKGSTIATYCAQHALSVNERIELMHKVCLGIEHAHQKGVLHCDLKPSNIVVTEIDGKAQPKIIDFGTARMLDREKVQASMYGTLAYIAPEQANPTASLDTRTDVYTLGLILYELLAGERLRKNLSTQDDLSLDALQAALAKQAATRLPSDLAGERLPRSRQLELQAIIERSVHPDPDSRYSGAAALASDLASWLALEPVKALPESTGYRWRCLIRRHRLAFGIAGLAVLSLLGGLVGTTLGLREAQHQRFLSEQRQDDLTQVVRFQQKMLTAIDFQDLAERLTERLAGNAYRLAIREGQDETSARQMSEQTRDMIEGLAPVDAARDLVVEGILGQSANIIDQDYRRADRVEAALRIALAQTLLSWQAFSNAEHQIQTARKIFAELGDSSSLDALNAETEAVKLHWWRSEFEAALELSTRLRPVAERSLGPDHELTLYLLRAQSSMTSYAGNLMLALELGSALRQRLIALHGPDHPDTIRAEADWLDIYQRTLNDQCPAELIGQYEQHLQRAATLSGPARRIHAISSMNLGRCLALNGILDEAIDWTRNAADAARETLGERHQITLVALNDTAWLLLLSGRYPEVDTMIQSLDELLIEVHGHQSHMPWFARSYRLALDSIAGRHGEAIAGFEQLAELVENNLTAPETLLRWVLTQKAMAQERAGLTIESWRTSDSALQLCLSSINESGCALERLETLRLALAASQAVDATVIDRIFEHSHSMHLRQDIRSLAAWLAFQTSQDPTRQQQILDQHLLWILASPERQLSARQQLIRDQLRSLSVADGRIHQ